jgi:hypothetical protein
LSVGAFESAQKNGETPSEAHDRIDKAFRRHAKAYPEAARAGM